METGVKRLRRAPIVVVATCVVLIAMTTPTFGNVRGRCVASRSAKVVVRSSTALFWYVNVHTRRPNRQGGMHERRYFGCADRRRPRRIATTFETAFEVGHGVHGAPPLRTVELAGHFLIYKAIREYRLPLVDLRTGHTRVSQLVQGPQDTLDAFILTAIAISNKGVIAWEGDSSSAFGEIGVVDGGGIRVLAKGDPGTFAGLSLRGDKVFWTQRGMPSSAAVTPPMAHCRGPNCLP